MPAYQLAALCSAIAVLVTAWVMWVIHSWLIRRELEKNAWDWIAGAPVESLIEFDPGIVVGSMYGQKYWMSCPVTKGMLGCVRYPKYDYGGLCLEINWENGARSWMSPDQIKRVRLSPLDYSLSRSKEAA